jgi:hypothetical protein
MNKELLVNKLFSGVFSLGKNKIQQHPKGALIYNGIGK